MSTEFRDSNERRDSVRKAVLLAATKRGSALLPVKGPDGSAPIVVAFEEESIRGVFERVNWSDGYANILLVRGDAFIVIPVEPSSTKGAHSSETNLLPVADTCDMGMLLHGLRAAGAEGKCVQLRVLGTTSRIRVLQEA